MNKLNESDVNLILEWFDQGNSARNIQRMLKNIGKDISLSYIYKIKNGTKRMFEIKKWNYQKSILEQRVKDPEFNNILAQEKLILSITEKVSLIMEEKNISKSELGKMIGKSKKFVTRFLNGNFSIKSVIDIFHALGYEFEIGVKRIK